jgi:hypothetical protein
MEILLVNFEVALSVRSLVGSKVVLLDEYSVTMLDLKVDEKKVGMKGSNLVVQKVWLRVV